MSRSHRIALVDWNWAGHHPTYFTHFAAAMAGAGAEVVPFCPDPEDFAVRLAGQALPDAASSLIHKATKIFPPPRSSVSPACWRPKYEAVRFFAAHGRRLRRWQSQHGRKIDLVFFACIYDRHFEYFGLAERLFGFPWAGLYLHARSFRMPGSPLPYGGGYPCPEKIFTLSSMRAVAVLDEGITEAMAQLTGGRPVHVFPDITDAALPAAKEAFGMATKIESFAGGRPIVSLTGHLQWTKGLDVFTDAAKDPRMQGLFFFLGGEVNWGEMSNAEKANLHRAWERLPNFYAHLQHLPEPTMNSVYAVSDVVVAAYRAFPNSSNALTKAAFLERPIVVSEGHVMAERVRRYQMGEVIPEGSADELVRALQHMVQPGYREELSRRARWKDYQEAHSLSRLDSVMRELLAS
jgi:hypothetical protein